MNFELLYACRLSGQITDTQWVEHLENDAGLKEWIEANTLISGA